MPASYRHRVKYHEADAQGFVFNGRFLELADVAMVELFRHLGWTYSQLNAGGMDPSVVHVSLEFVSPAFFDDELDVDVTCTRVGRSSFDLRTVVTRSGDVIARIDAVYVNVDTSTRKSRPIPKALAQALDAEALAATAADHHAEGASEYG